MMARARRFLAVVVQVVLAMLVGAVAGGALFLLCAYPARNPALLLIPGVLSLAVGFYVAGYVAAALPFGSRRHGPILVPAAYAMLCVWPLLRHWLGIGPNPRAGGETILWAAPYPVPAAGDWSWGDAMMLALQIPLAFLFAWLGGRQARRRRGQARAAAGQGPERGGE